MSEKLVNLLYTPVDAQLIIKGTEAKVPKPKTLLARSDITQLETDSNQDSLKVVFTGFGESAIPTPGKFKRLTDSLVNQSIFSVSMGVPVNDSRSVIDIFSTQTSFVRSFVNTGLVQEYLLVGYNKLVPEIVANTTLDTKSVSKVKNSVVTIIETQVKQFNKPGLFSLVQVSDISLSQPQLFKPELVNTSTEFSYLTSFIRNFNEFVDATDDVYGSANLDDDQYALFGKTVHTLYQTPDTVQKSASKYLFTQNTSTDTKYAKAIKYLPDFVNVAVLNTLRPNKRPVSIATTNSSKQLTTNKSVFSTSAAQDQLLDYVATKGVATTVSPLDAVQQIFVNYNLITALSNTDNLVSLWSANRAVTSQLFSADVSYIDAQKTLSTNFTALAQHSGNLSKLLSTSNQQTYDLLSTQVSYVRQLQDYVYSTDDVYGASNIDDDQYADFNKNIINVLLTNSLLNVSASKLVSSDIAAAQTFEKLLDTFQQSNTVLETLLFSQANKLTFSESNTVESAAISSSVIYNTNTNAVFEALVTQADKTLNSTSLPEESISGSSGKFLSNLFGSLDTLVYFKFLDRFFFTETTVSTDGFANTQNYFAEAYVEPGYVGTNTYFS